jgi:hypothetical protein
VHDELSFLLADALTMRAAPLPPVGGEWQLPPLAGDRGGLEPGTLIAIGKAYLFAELETAGLIVCADAVVEARSALRVSTALAGRLERYAELQRYSPSTLDREAFFVRWFGIGRHAAVDERGNHAFFPRMSELCGALAALAHSGVGATPPTFARERSRSALERLVAQLALLAGGDLAMVARIERLASEGVAILSDRELAALLGVTGFAAVVQTLVGGVAQDIAVAYRRGRTGQVVLEDCARLLPRLATGGAGFVDASDPAVLHAVQWLASYDLRASG